MELLNRLFRKETTTETIRRLNVQRQRETQKWEESSPDSAREQFLRSASNFRNCPKYSDRWLLLEQDSRSPSHRPPKWVARIAERTWDRQRGKATGVPIFLHRRFTSYKIDYNDFDGYIILKGAKPVSITRIDSQLQQLHKKEQQNG